MQGKVREQGPWVLQLRTDDASPPPAVPPAFPDSADWVAYLADWVSEQQADAYWEAGVDSLYRRGPRTYVAVLHRGPAYRWAELRPPTEARALPWLKRSGYRPRQFTDRLLDPAAWTSLRDSTLRRAGNAGYPFAGVGLDSIRWHDDRALAARIVVDPGPLVRIGAVRAPDAARVRPAFLERYLGLRPGEAYRADRVRRLATNLRQLPYLTMKGQPRISFEDTLAYVDLPLQKRPASRFDFVIGVLPNSSQTGELLITGELNGELRNGLGQGERVALRFEQLRPQTQELEVGLEYPFLFGLPFGLEAELDLYRRDSSFLNLRWHLAATYLREGNDRLSFFWENRRTIVPGERPVSGPTPAGGTPDTVGVVRSFFGLRARRVRTDRRFSPRRGYAADVSLAAGFRRLPDAPEDPLGEVTERTAQGQLQLDAGAFVSPLNGFVLHFGLRAAALVSGRTVFANEQYRIGGARLLRGFDEQSVFARDYAVLTTEARLLLGGEAFLYAFVDAARVNPRNASEPTLAIDYPLGLGVGVNFDTRAGVFGLSLAVGRSNGNPLRLDAPKLHFGYVSLF